MQLVVVNDCRNSSNNPRRCTVSVSSKPSSRLPTADWLISPSSARTFFNVALAFS